MYRYLAVDTAMRYGTCIRLDGAKSYTIFTIVSVAVTEMGIIDVYTEFGTTNISKEEFVDYAKSVEYFMFEKHGNNTEICIVDGTAMPALCKSVVNVAKSPIKDSEIAYDLFVRNAKAEDINNIITLNKLAHKEANKIASLLWSYLQRKYSCTVPFGSHPVLERSLFFS